MRLAGARPAAAPAPQGACAASARRARSLAAVAAPRRARAAAVAAPPDPAPPAPPVQQQHAPPQQRVAPAAGRSVHVGNIPFAAAPGDVAAALLSALRSRAGGASAARLVTRVVVSDYSACGVAEFECPGFEKAEPQPLALPPPWPGAHAEAPRKARDAGKRNRGFALLCCASASGAAAAAAALAAPEALGDAAAGALAGRELRVGGDGGAAAALYVRELVAASAAAEARRSEEREARRAARAPHRQRQKARARVARDADLAALLRAAFASDAQSAAQLAAAADFAAAASHEQAAAVEALWAGAFAGWADADAAVAAGALPWAEAPDAADPCRGGGLDPAPGGRGERKRQQVETFVAALRGLGLARPGATLVDFGAGTGSLGVALAWALPFCHVIAVDAKAQSVQRLADRAQQAGLANCSAVVGDISHYDGPCDVALGLHVCGRGTDAVLAAAAARRVPFVVSPCCIGKVNVNSPGGAQVADDGAKTPLITHPRSRALRQRLSEEQYARLAAAADFSGDSAVDGYDGGSAAGALPRAAKAAVEADRAAAAAEARFGVRLLKLLHPGACVRNDLLVGWPLEDASIATAARRLFTPPAAPPPYAREDAVAVE